MGNIPRTRHKKEIVIPAIKVDILVGFLVIKLNILHVIFFNPVQQQYNHFKNWVVFIWSTKWTNEWIDESMSICEATILKLS